jgi:hypothetical protein
MRILVLHHEGAPLLASFTAGPIKERILELPPDDADLFAVFEVPTDGSMMPSRDITEQFAKTWAIECEFGAGAEPEVYLALCPAFVLHHCRDELIRIWQRRRAAADESFMPAVLSSARVAA